MYKYIYLFRDHGQFLENRRGIMLSLVKVSIILMVVNIIVRCGGGGALTMTP